MIILVDSEKSQGMFSLMTIVKLVVKKKVLKPYLHNHVLNVHHGDKMLAHTGNHILGQTDGECLCMYGLWKFI